MKPEKAIKEKKQKRKNKKKKHTKKACKCGEKMDKSQMPEWAEVIYHQNKAIMAELGIEE
jgi:hypothetical protein